MNTTKSKPTYACFLTVRTGSTRLPQKTLLPVLGKRLIEHVIDRMKLLKKEVDKIILCTSTEPEDDILETIAKKNKIPFFRGSLHDKVSRWLGAANKFKVDYFMVIDAADDVFCDPELITLAIRQMKKEPCDYLEIPDDLVCGGASRCISVSALRKVNAIKDTDNVEDYRPYFTKTGQFIYRDIAVKDKIFHNTKIRLTMDYIEDYELFLKIFEGMKMKKNTMPLRKILAFLKRKPELVKINYFRHKQFWDNLAKNNKLILKKA